MTALLYLTSCEGGGLVICKVRANVTCEMYAFTSPTQDTQKSFSFAARHHLHGCSAHLAHPYQINRTIT